MTALLALFDRLMVLLAITIVGVLLVVVSAGIASRALDHPLAFTDELAGFLMVWLACLGWILATRRRAHIRIAYFQGKLPERLRLGAEALIQAGILLLGCVIAYKSLRLLAINADVEAVTLPISTAWMYAFVPIAGLTTALQSAAELIESMRRLAGNREASS